MARHDKRETVVVYAIDFCAVAATMGCGPSAPASGGKGGGGGGAKTKKKPQGQQNKESEKSSFVSSMETVNTGECN